ncbi:MAG: DEAD/DEAH box helicase, partial [Fimbriimonas sp.]|nr:DEAD/DEAH box helicase [Fimbriimonas sp.]
YYALRSRFTFEETDDVPESEVIAGLEELVRFEEELERAKMTEHPRIQIPMAKPVTADVEIPSDVSQWLRDVKGLASTFGQVNQKVDKQVCYVLGMHAVAKGLTVPTITVTHRSLLKNGEYGRQGTVKLTSATGTHSPDYWTPLDCTLIQDLRSNTSTVSWDQAAYRLDGRHGYRLLRDIVATGRCTWHTGQSLRPGEARSGSFEWVVNASDSSLTPTIRSTQTAVTLPVIRPSYVDLATSECGLIECGLRDELASAILAKGRILPEQVSHVRRELAGCGISSELLPPDHFKVSVRTPEVRPCLTVELEVCLPQTAWARSIAMATIAFADLRFNYDGHLAPLDGGDIRLVEGDNVLIIRRNKDAERNAREFLKSQAWREPFATRYELPPRRNGQLILAPIDPRKPDDPLDDVHSFAMKVAPGLRDLGWTVEIVDSLRSVASDEIEWDVAIDSNQTVDWFEFRLGIRVDGEPIDVRPILVEYLKEQARPQLSLVRGTPAAETEFTFTASKGRILHLDRHRLNAILRPLTELFGSPETWPQELRAAKALVTEVSGLSAGEWKTSKEFRELRKKLAKFDRLQPQSESEGFRGVLREYQREGLAWLQFLREYNFGGVLADDMGLGKTVQILAHILTEKVSGRMLTPCLIVAPTSTMPNWLREAERFAPELKVVTLQGTGRGARFADLDGVDIALTTYPLLDRDKDKLGATTYHVLVLDEAQNVKNASTAAARAARDLSAKHRVCLSGTPVENHLGELWSLFHFLVPGFLGSEGDFKKRFRTPIERNSDKDARKSLARRVRPFMLRRTKGQVASELPDKTEIIESIEFDDDQRDLYESIRMAMDKQVRDLIAAQGFDRSRIQILDALLKLRQVCCDPSLLKIPSAKKVSESAKLGRLSEMLSVLVEDGRRVLVFSQFTSMLDLIEARLRTVGISWVRISGDTKDRDTPVKQFQSGNVPVFLISLKAGGTGLNLTAADTVILYDPWWNPAVENQAIDRAHRIGQDKAEIVYKMVVSGTIEEKMLELQARKGDIARSILTDDAEGIRTLTSDDLKWILS